MKTWLTKQQVLLSSQVVNHTLPHALLINGAKSSGKTELAQWLNNVLLCQAPYQSSEQLLTACGKCKTCHLYLSGNHADYLTLTTTTRSIGVDDIRKVSRFLEKKAHLGLNKLVLIPTAEKMTTAAANALLKTLEEPNADNIIVLLTSEVSILLPTIISRCQLLTVTPPVGDALLAQLGQDKTDSFVNFTHLPELTDDKLIALYDKFQQQYLHFLLTKQGLSELIQQLTNIAEALRWLEKISVNLLRAKHDNGSNFIIDKAQLAQLTEVLTDENLWQIYQKIVSTCKQVKSLTQINTQFAMEKLLIDIGSIIDIAPR